MNDPWKIVDHVCDLVFVGPIPSSSLPDQYTNQQVSLKYSHPRGDARLATQLRAVRYTADHGNFFKKVPYSCFPHEVTAKFTRGLGVHTHGSVPMPEARIHPPAKMKNRKDHPLELPQRYFDQSGSMTLTCTVKRESVPVFFLFGLVQARPLQAVPLCEELSTMSVISKEDGMRVASRLLHRDKANADDDLEVISVHNVSLKCLSTHCRIGVPARSVKCRHVQCFDLEFYITSQGVVDAHNSRWKCVVCDVTCLPHEIIIDGFMKSILAETSEEDAKVYLDVVNEDTVTWRVTERDDLNDSDSDDAPGRPTATAAPDVVELD